jgi:hypothetical protein
LKLADLLVLPLLPIDPLKPGTIQGGLAIAVPELKIWRSFGKTDDAALGHD